MNIETLTRWFNRAVEKKRLATANALRKEIKRCEGREDRKAGRACATANGAYLEGYHGDPDDTGLYYCTVGSISALYA